MRSRRKSTPHGPRTLEDAGSIRDLYSLRLNESCKVAAMTQVKRQAAVKLETSRETNHLTESSSHIQPVKNEQPKHHGRKVDHGSSSDQDNKGYVCAYCLKSYKYCTGLSRHKKKCKQHKSSLHDEDKDEDEDSRGASCYQDIDTHEDVCHNCNRRYVLHRCVACCDLSPPGEFFSCAIFLAVDSVGTCVTPRLIPTHAHVAAVYLIRGLFLFRRDV